MKTGDREFAAKYRNMELILALLCFPHTDTRGTRRVSIAIHVGGVSDSPSGRGLEFPVGGVRSAH